MIVLVCGGRDYNNSSHMARTLDDIHAKTPITKLVYGMARGADSLAESWAASHLIARSGFPADWNKHGKAAGPIRNQQMLDQGKPDLVVAFPGGRGTADMVRRAKAAGVKVIHAR